MSTSAQDPSNSGPTGGLKRRRTDASDEESPPTRHSTLWFDDGNIVLIAQDTAFRVHSSILSLKSPVFKDMFSMPQPASGADSFEGCPAVLLTDNPTELADLLDFVYNGSL